MTRYMIFFALLLGLGFYGQSLHAQHALKSAAIEKPIVIELFTSQSCSSCPPADKIFASIANKENVIALGCHVSYWDHLHWKDTLSQDFCDMRQHGYAGLKGTKRIYTPQMIVNGSREFIGSHAAKLDTAIKNAHTIQTITIKNGDGNLIDFAIPKTGNGTYRLWAFGYKSNHKQDIKSGENRGRKVTYANAVTTYTNLGAWNGESIAKSFEKPDGYMDGIVVIAQENGYGKIIAAGKMSF